MNLDELEARGRTALREILDAGLTSAWGPPEIEAVLALIAELRALKAQMNMVAGELANGRAPGWCVDQLLNPSVAEWIKEQAENDREGDALKAHLREIEWSGRTTIYPPGSAHRCCPNPKCRGIDPTDVQQHLRKIQVGHAPDCWLAAAIR